MKISTFQERRDQERLKWAKSLPVGSFSGRYFLEWVGPELFRVQQEKHNPFIFVRGNGQQIVLGENVLTDGATIKEILQSISGITRWKYGHASTVHDFLFDEHHAGRGYSFKETNLIMCEVMVTMMKTKMVETNYKDVVTVHRAISSTYAKKIWNT